MPALSQSHRALENLEPLVSETRLAAIEARLRREHPKLPDNAVFVAYREPQQTIEVEREGILSPLNIAPRACFAIFIPHPKHPEKPGFGYLPTGRMFYDQRDADKAGRGEIAWNSLEFDHRHSSEIESDPAYLAFKYGPIKEAVAWYDSVKDLIVKEPVNSGTNR